MARFSRFRPCRAWRTGAWLAGLTLWALTSACGRSGLSAEDEFIKAMNSGKNYLDQGQAEKALPLFQRAVELQPSRPDALLNLANTHLLGNDPTNAIRFAKEALNFDRNSAAAYYVAGCGYLRLRQFEEALQFLQPARDLDPTVAAVSYQIARAHAELGQADAAMAAYQETIALEPEHPVAHYALGQLLIRSGQQDEGMEAIQRHEAIRAKGTGAPATPEQFEKCKHTAARAPLQILKPDKNGIPVTFADATAAAFGAGAGKYAAPLGVIDYNHDDRNSLFVFEPGSGFRVLDNQRGTFKPLGEALPTPADAAFRRIVVGDFNNDRIEDVLAAGESGSQIFRFATNGAARDFTTASNLRNLKLLALDAVALDLDFTGKLDIVAVLPGGSGLRVLRNLGNMYFKDITATSGVPTEVNGVRQLAVDDWNNDDLLDLLVGQESRPPLYLEKVRGAPLMPTNLPPGQLDGAVIAIGDVNGDLRVDLLAGSPQHVDVLLGGVNRFLRLPIAQPGLESLRLVDFDNDGWLDILAVGDGLQLWRNIGDGQFVNVTAATKLDQVPATRIRDVALADFDQDGDTDFVLALADGGLRFYRNDGGNANLQLKLRLLGKRSNASGLGIRVEIAAGAFRVHRTLQTLPLEIGVARNDKLDSVTARWFDLSFNQVDVKPDPKASIVVFEPELPVGSCPYVYVWDGEKFRFVSDILGSAPVGLRLTDSVFIDADPFEYVLLGTDRDVAPRNGRYALEITEELREVLYLDEAKLVVVDHPEGTEVHTTDKLRPAKPFPRGELWTLASRKPLQKATTLDGADVTDALQENDGHKVSPARLRIPQLRGLAEPHGVILDFGPLDHGRPLVLALTGWLRFGGGMANVGASHDPELPFPFPTLEVETEAAGWTPVAVTVGAPSGKTKTILVDLAGQLPAGSRRLKLSAAFELHWDRIALFERAPGASTRILPLTPDRADLYWRGFSEFADLPWTFPLTPVFDRVFQNPHWAITPTGWCTRYGPVGELIAEADNGLAILNGGDALRLEFDSLRVPAKPAGYQRSFFLYSVGWDKDADFHVELGWQVEPLPWHGMDDQAYGREARPPFASDALNGKYNTRWVPQPTLKRAAK
ncbi:MAG: VCBS repeat-containing protein [Verrucomicrobia bacterium]|nr:VCBS repeat-containing protein [Verrucomicrobiota bacterium]